MVKIVKLKATNQKIVTLDEVKRHLRKVNDRDDNYIYSLIDVATEQVENYVDYIITEKKYKAEFDSSVTGSPIQVGYFNQVNIESIKVYDSNDIEILESVDYRLLSDDIIVKIEFNSIPENADRIDIVFISKPTEIMDIPFSFKQACMLKIGDMYNNRQDEIIGRSSTNIRAFEMLLNPYRKISFK